MQLFSYVVDHDDGGAPHAKGRYCTLVHCKFGGELRRRNIVEMAQEGDWILGSGGTSSRSAGRGKVIYLMRVDKKLSFAEYLSTDVYRGRADCKDHGSRNMFALVSSHFFYFGRNAIPIAELPQSIPNARLLKWGMGYRRDYPEASLKKLIEWFERRFEPGIHGAPCGVSQSCGPKVKKRPGSCPPRRVASVC
jgi:hypothetical protein